MADLMSASPNGPCPYPGELSVTAVPGCTRAGLPMVARRGSEVRGKSDKGDKPRKGEAQRCAGVHEVVCKL